MTSKPFDSETARREAANRKASRAIVYINSGRLHEAAEVIDQARSILRAPAFDPAGACKSKDGGEQCSACNCWKRARGWCS